MTVSQTHVWGGGGGTICLPTPTRGDIINVLTYSNAYLCYYFSDYLEYLYVPGWDGRSDINTNVRPTLIPICATIIVSVISICMYLDAQILILMFRLTLMLNCAAIIDYVLSNFIYLDGMVAQISILMFQPTLMPICATIKVIVLSFCM